MPRQIHRLSRTPTFNVWMHMKQRCSNPKNKAYKHYGARGISVCKRWSSSFLAFLADMGDKPKGKTLDRRNNNRGYSPGNCRWATPAQQSRNTRANRRLAYKGQRRILGDIAAFRGCARETLKSRLTRGWSVSDALHKPFAKKAQRRGAVITLDGRGQTLTKWAEETGLPFKTLSARFAAGWSTREALQTPKRVWN